MKPDVLTACQEVPAEISAVSPKLIAVPFKVKLGFANFALAIEPANISFVTDVAGNVTVLADMSKDELNWMKSVSYRYATPTALYRYAQALALNNQLHEAKKHLLIIEKLHHKKFSTESLYQVNDSLIFGWKNTGK